MTAHRLFLCSLLALAITGCSSQQVITAPQPEALLSFTTSGDVEQSAQWWLSFDDQQLNQLMTMALSDNFSFLATIDRLEQAQALAQKSGANTGPTLNGTLDAGRTFQDGGDVSSFKAGLMATYEIDLWSRLAAKRTAAEFDYQASREELQTAAITLSSEVASRWYELVTQEALNQLYTQQISNLEKQVALIELRFRFGQSKAEDLMQQQQTLESLKANRLSAQYQADLIRQQIALLIGKSSLPELTIPVLPTLKALPATGVPAELTARRPDLKQAWYQVQSQHQSVIVAEAERLPQISLTASLISSDQNFSDFLDNWVGNLTAGLVAPLFDSGLRESEVDYQTAALNESLNSYSHVVLEAFIEVETALTREQSQQEQLKSINRQLSLASSAEQIKQKRYQNGENNFLEFLTAQNSRLTLEQQQVQSQGQLLAERILLHRALAGELPEQSIPSISASRTEESQ